MNSLTRPMFYNERGIEEKTGERFWTRQQSFYSTITIQIPAWDARDSQGDTWVQLSVTPEITNNTLFSANQITVYGRIYRNNKYIRFDIQKYLNKQWRALWGELDGDNCDFDDANTGVVEAVDKISITTRMKSHDDYDSIRVYLPDCTIDAINFMTSDYTCQFNSDVIYARRGFVGTLYGEADTAKSVKYALKAYYWGNDSVVYNGSTNVSIYTLPQSYNSLFNIIQPGTYLNEISFQVPDDGSISATGLIACNIMNNDSKETVKYIPFSFVLSQNVIQNAINSANMFSSGLEKVAFNISGADFSNSNQTFKISEIGLTVTKQTNSSFSVGASGKTIDAAFTIFKYELVELQVTTFISR